MSKLTAKQRRFVEEYLVDKNATQAAIRAGYSAKTAHAIGHENLSKPEIASEIDAQLAAMREKTGITVERVAAELAKIGFADVRKLFKGDGLVSIEALDDETAGAVSSVEVVTRAVPGSESDDGLKEVEHVHKIKLWDKRAALVDLGKHLGMFVERHEHTGRDGGPIETKDVSDAETADRLLAFAMSAEASLH